MYTKGVAGKFGCSAKLKRPRSELEFTARASTGAGWTMPLTTRLTCPDAFSRTRASFAARNTMPIGCDRPLTNVVTSRFESRTVVGVVPALAGTTHSTKTRAAAQTAIIDAREFRAASGRLSSKRRRAPLQGLIDIGCLRR